MYSRNLFVLHFAGKTPGVHVVISTQEQPGKAGLYLLQPMYAVPGLSLMPHLPFVTVPRQYDISSPLVSACQWS